MTTCTSVEVAIFLWLQGLVNTHYVYLPIPTVISAPRKVTEVPL